MVNSENAIKQYLVSFGAVPIDLSTVLPDFDEIEPDKIKETERKIYTDIVNVIRESPHACDIQAPSVDNIRMIYNSFGENGTVPYLLDPIKIECNLPERLQTIDLPVFKLLHPSAELDTSSNFSLLFDGVCFAFFRPITKPYGICCGAPDARKLLEDILKQKFNIISTFPTPLRQDFIIDIDPHVDLSDEISIKKLQNGNVLIKTKAGIQNPENFIKLLFSLNHFQLRNYYSLTSEMSQKTIYEFIMSQTCDKILMKRSEGLRLNNLNFFQKRKIILDLEQLIQKFYSNYSKWSDLKNSIARNIPDIEGKFSEPLNEISEELLKAFRDTEIPIRTHLDIVELAQNSVSEYKQAQGLWLTIIVSLLSAIIGAWIGVSFAK